MLSWIEFVKWKKKYQNDSDGFLELTIDFGSQILSLFDYHFLPFNKADEKINSLFVVGTIFATILKSFLSNSINMVKYLLRANSYQHPLEFAADMRRIITETYRYTMPKDPLVDLAGKLQSEFEMCFAKIDFSVSSQLDWYTDYGHPERAFFLNP